MTSRRDIRIRAALGARALVAMAALAIAAAPALAQSILFTDVSSAAGLTTFTHSPNSLMVPSVNEWIMGGIGVGDFNGDGRDDTLLEYESGWRSFRNGSDGAITDIGFSYGSVVIGLGDFDGDGKDDTLLEYETGWRSFRSGGDGAITDIGFSYGSTVVGIGDFDADGKDDTLLAYDSGWLSIRKEASGSITDIGFQNGYEVVGIGDFDGDGQDDVLLNFTATGWHKFISGGTTGQDVDVGFVYVSVVGIDDFNGDGSDDLLIRDTTDYVTYAPGANLAESVAVGDYTGQDIVHDMGTGIESDMLIA